MVKNQNQLDIANKSYTNKDFSEIYKELLTYAEKLSYRFSPVSANEADPFIVLLKLLAFVADKINYNIDKNILERFMLSCTQETSMRELASIVGYYMHYYRAAYTSVLFTHNDKEKTIIIPKYSVLTTDNNLQFVTIEQTQINAGPSRSSLPVLAMQGKLKTLSILGSELIQLENLDSNNRLYFSEYQVAENGVFIEQLSPNGYVAGDWRRVDNLNEEEYLSYIYYFGYDSNKRLPYIEFPNWISRIIGNGLLVRYIVTDGYAGNIGAKTLTQVMRASKPEGDELDDATITVINSSAASNGADPETIEESYSGFKKLVGTLDTLVTCRDYAARICELLDANGYPMVSNAIVSDRRTDINYSSQLYTYNDLGKHCVVKPCVKYLNEGAATSNVPDSLSANELCMYAYKPMLSKGYLNAFSADNGYQASYKAYTELNSAECDQIIQSLESAKAMSHDYRQLSGDDILAVQIKVAIQAVVSTYTKVSEIEAHEIKLNVLDALVNKYNLHNLTPGFEIPFDDIYDTILYADPRIKSVSLSEPIQTPEISMYSNGGLSDDVAKDKAMAFLVVKNIISGRISAFSFDDRFDYEYSYKDATVFENIQYVTTCPNIVIARKDGNLNENFVYELRDNEVIQFIAPKLNTTVTYPYGVVYSLKLIEGNTCIPKNAEYCLKSGEHLMLAYADSDNYWSFDYYAGGSETDSSNPTIINPNFDMYTCENRRSKGNTPTKKFNNENSNTKFTPYEGMVFDSDGYWFYALNAKDELHIKNPVEEALTSTTYAYWITRNPGNKINWIEVDDKISEYILREDEYFYYCDAALTYLVEFSSGTKLVVPTAHIDNIHAGDWTIQSPVSADSIANDGISGLAGSVEILACSATCPLQIFVNEIKTLSHGDKIIIERADNSNIAVPNNTFEPLSQSGVSKIMYKYDSAEASSDTEVTTEVLPDRSTLNAKYTWRWRGVLDINVSPSTEQLLYPGIIDGPGHTIKLIPKGEEESDVEEISAGDSADSMYVGFRCSTALNINGGQQIPVSFINIDSLSLSEACPSFLTYSKDPVTAGCTQKLDMQGLYNMRVELDGELSSETYDGYLCTEFGGEPTQVNFHLPGLYTAQEGAAAKCTALGAATLILPDSYQHNAQGEISLSMNKNIKQQTQNKKYIIPT